MTSPEGNLFTLSPVLIHSLKKSQLHGNISRRTPQVDEISCVGHETFFHSLIGLVDTMHNGLLEISLLVSDECHSCAGKATDRPIGITVGAVVVPQSMAYARLAELPPQFGLYSSFMGVLIYWFFATSKDITIGVWRPELHHLTVLIFSSPSPSCPL